MKKALILVIAALAIPGIALASGLPARLSSHGHSHDKPANASGHSHGQGKPDAADRDDLADRDGHEKPDSARSHGHGHGKPDNAGHGHGHGHGAQTVMYVLKGTISAYTAYDATTHTAGSITLLVDHANHHGQGLVGQTVTFPVDANTQVALADGQSAIARSHSGMVQIRAPKNIAAADLATTLKTLAARQVIDMGAES
ncbi:MAG: hypothetical protein QOG85_1806 [Gaiellaceae bacterium]|jgi:hypothetical protein|nr:hypothetical protein [Gaiellaceae bacterium]